MSRHEFTTQDPTILVAIGWDNALTTFFACVTQETASDDDDNILLWIGTNELEIQSAQELRSPLLPYFQLTHEHITVLEADRLAMANCPPTALQQTLLDLVGTKLRY